MAIDSPIPTWVKRWLGICTFVLIYDGCFCTLRPHTFPDGCLSVFFIGRKCFSNMHAWIQRWDRWSGPPPPHGKSQNIWFPCNTGPDPLKNHKTTKPDSTLDQHRPASETTFKRRFAGGPLMSWNPSHKTFWIRA